MLYAINVMMNCDDFYDEAEDTAAQTVGQRVRQLRMQQNLTQRELAERGGLSTSVISLIEREQRMPSIRTIRKLAAALGCTLIELLDLPRHPKAPADPSRRYDHVDPGAQSAGRRRL